MANKFKNVLPFILCTSITIGGFKLFLNSTPIYSDKINKYKEYSFECDSNNVE